MRIVVQRSKQASVTVKGKVVGKIDFGMVVLVGFTHQDSIKDIDYLVNKIVHLRIFDDEKGVMNKSLLEVGGSVLSVSQFTLYGDASKGRRPSYIKALNPQDASILYDLFNQKLKEYVPVEMGVFQAEMEVSLINDGPVTILIESEDAHVKE